MPNASLVAIGEFHSIDDVVSGLKAMEAVFAATADRRGVFLEAYLLITLELKQPKLAHGDQIEHGKPRDSH